MATYPITPTTATLDNVLTVAVPRDFRDSGWVQSTAVVKDPSGKINRSVDIQKLTRKLDFKTLKLYTAALAAATPAAADVLQLLPVSAGDVITSVSVRVIRANSQGTGVTATVKLGATSVTGAVDLLTLGTTASATGQPIAVGATADTLDLTLAATTGTFDALIEVTVIMTANRG